MLPSWRAIRALLALNYGISLQYRAQSVLWMINGAVPLIMMLIVVLFLIYWLLYR